MKLSRHFFRTALLALTLVIAGSASAQKKPKMKTAEIFAATQPGVAVKIEGMIQKDFSVVCTDVKILTVELAENKWSIEGFPRSIDPAQKAFKMLLVPVKTQPNTKFKSNTNIAFKSFAQLTPETFVELDGIYQKDGTFLALEIDDQAEKLAAKPHLRNMVELCGEVENVDATKRTMTVMGITFQFTDKSEGEFAVK